MIQSEAKIDLTLTLVHIFRMSDQNIPLFVFPSFSLIIIEVEETGSVKGSL